MEDKNFSSTKNFYFVAYNKQNLQKYSKKLKIRAKGLPSIARISFDQEFYFSSSLSDYNSLITDLIHSFMSFYSLLIILKGWALAAPFVKNSATPTAFGVSLG